MPMYAFSCPNCQNEFKVSLGLADRGLPQVCPECQGKETTQVVPQVSFVLKGDAWPGKALKIRNQMEAKNRRLDTKSKNRSPGLVLAPNVNGERVDSWAEASKLAASKGKDTSTYDNKVQKEQGKNP